MLKSQVTHFFSYNSIDSIYEVFLLKQLFDALVLRINISIFITYENKNKTKLKSAKRFSDFNFLFYFPTLRYHGECNTQISIFQYALYIYFVCIHVQL